MGTVGRLLLVAASVLWITNPAEWRDPGGHGWMGLTRPFAAKPPTPVVGVTDVGVFSIARSAPVRSRDVTGAITRAVPRRWVGALGMWMEWRWRTQTNPLELVERATAEAKKLKKDAQKRIRTFFRNGSVHDRLVLSHVLVFAVTRCLDPYVVMRHFTLQSDSLQRPWTLLTCTLHHADALNLVMFISMLKQFGPLLEQKIAPQYFLPLYSLVGLSCTSGMLLWHLLFRTTNLFFHGGVGNIVGILAALATLTSNSTFEESNFFIFGIGPMNAMSLCLSLIGFHLLVQGSMHLPGLLAGAAAGVRLAEYYASRSTYMALTLDKLAPLMSSVMDIVGEAWHTLV